MLWSSAISPFLPSLRVRDAIPRPLRGLISRGRHFQRPLLMCPDGRYSRSDELYQSRCFERAKIFSERRCLTFEIRLFPPLELSALGRSGFGKLYNSRQTPSRSRDGHNRVGRRGGPEKNPSFRKNEFDASSWEATKKETRI